MVSDEELIYLYRQGNDWALQELFERYLPIIYKGVLTNKKELKNLEYDEAECLSKCYLKFFQCIDYYCEHKDVSFGAYAYLCGQYEIKNYGRKICSPKYSHLSYETIGYDKAMVVQDIHGNPKRMVEFKEQAQQLNKLSEKVKGVEKAVLTCLLAGCDLKELDQVLPYEKKTINNALYRIRQKLKNNAEGQ